MKSIVEGVGGWGCRYYALLVLVKQASRSIRSLCMCMVIARRARVFRGIPFTRNLASRRMNASTCVLQFRQFDRR